MVEERQYDEIKERLTEVANEKIHVDALRGAHKYTLYNNSDNSNNDNNNGNKMTIIQRF